VTHTYAACGDKTVTLKGKSTFGNEYGEVVKTVDVKCGPIAKITVDPVSECVYKADDPATFSSSDSTPGGSPIVSYHWEFSDGQYESTSETVTRPIPEDGVTATLTVTDSLDCEDTDDVKVGVCVEYVGCAIRMYGFLDKGAGDRSIDCENPPYTNAMDPFWPQADQAPEKDFLTFNPIVMQHGDKDWDNDGVTDNVYKLSIKNNLVDANEKEFFRMWYEPVEWIKDENGDGEFDVVLTNGNVVTIDQYEANLLDYLDWGVGIKTFNENKPERIADIYAPTIKQEFTFMFLDTNNNPKSAPTGTSKFLIPMASWVNDNGIDSFDADGDGTPDPVVVCSEDDLGDVNSDGIPDFLDIDGDGLLETLSDDGCQLTEDDTLVLRLDTKTLAEGERIQFFDFEIELEDTSEASRAIVNIYYRGNPNSEGNELIGTVDLTADLHPTLGASVATFERGGVNTHVSPRGPGFIWVTNVDWEDDTVRIIVGRMFGNTHENIGDMYNNGESAWAYQKHFYVDGVLYNVVAILTEGHENLKYVTFRAKLVKVPLWIENHSNQLVGWAKDEGCC
jgi:hypothetical protein